MANDSTRKKVFALSPYVEVGARHVYWNGIRYLKRFRGGAASKSNPGAPAPQAPEAPPAPVDFQKITSYLGASGAREGRILLVHSAFRPLKPAKLSPAAIVDALLALVGPSGTLAMPAMPSFENDPSLETYLTTDISDRVFVYDVQNSPIKTGVLPAALHKKAGSVRSRHPINTMVAFGAQASALMKDNLAGPQSLPCGVTSSWKRCADQDALIVGLGTDLTHALTMIHVAEDVLDERWPVKGWYRPKRFIVRDGGADMEVTLRERAPVWGALHFAERTLCRDLMEAGLLKSVTIDGVLVETLGAQALLRFLNDRNANGYPYFLATLRAKLRR